jgi:hypothetical protein
VPTLPARVLPPPPPGASAAPVAARQIPPPGPAPEGSPDVTPPLVVASSAGATLVRQSTAARPEPTTSPAPASPAGSLTTLYQQAAEGYRHIDSYSVKLTRRGRAVGKDRPEEVILLKVRRSPPSVYLRWVGGEGAGREAVYVQGRYGDKVHTRQPPRGGPLGLLDRRRDSLPAGSPLAHCGSRRTITDLSIGPWIDRFGDLVEAAARGDLRGGSVRYLGRLKCTDFEQPVEAVLHAIPPGADPELPRGGQRSWYFDVNRHLPVLVVTRDEKGRDVEYNRFDDFLVPTAGPWPDDHFNPGVLWGH